MRNLLLNIMSYIIAFQLVFASASMAGSAVAFPDSPSETLQEDASEPSQDIQVDRYIQDNSLKENSKSLQEAGHLAQTFLLITMFACVDIVKQSIRISNLKKESMNKKEILLKSTEAATSILNQGSIWISLFFSALGTRATRLPQEIFQNIIQNQQTLALFKNLLISGIATNITFVGWEGGGQFLEESRNQIVNSQDYELSKNLWSNIGASLMGSPNEQRVLKLLIANMGNILLNNHQLLERWVYNTWRMRIATGNFVTLVASLVTVGALCSAFIPEAGAILLFAFGVAGLTVATQVVPESLKEYLTDTFIQLRANSSKLQNYKHRYFLEKTIQRIENLDKIMIGNKPETILAQEKGLILLLENQFKKMKAVRLDFLSKSYEEIYLINKNMTKLKGEFRLAKNYDSNEEADRLSSLIAKNEVQISTQLKALSAWLALEAAASSDLVLNTNKKSVKSLILTDLNNIGTLQSKISETINQFNADRVDHSVLKSLSKIWLFGF